MKMYTNESQTAKLIELGFEKPNNTVYKQVAKRKIGYGIIEWEDAGEEGSYSIGELVDMLPQYLDYKGGVADMPIDYYALTIRQNIVMYCDPYMDWGRFNATTTRS